MKKAIRAIIIIIMAGLILTILSCGDSNNGNNNSNNSVNNDPDGEMKNEQAQAAEEEKIDAVSILAGLPESDYGGYEFKIWTTNWYNPTAEGRQAPETEQTGDPVNDALFIRDRLVEDKYNIQIKYDVFTDDPHELLSKSLKSIKAGDNEFDCVIDNMKVVTSGLAQEGALYDFNTVPNIDLTKEWWSKYAIRDLTINGRFYFPTGDVTARYSLAQNILMFNKKVFADMGLEYPYKTILDGNWTFDEFTNLIKGKTRDLNGDGVIDKSDFFGLITYDQGAASFLHASGESIIKIADGNPVLNINNPKTVDIMDKIASFWIDPAYNPYTVKVYYEEIPMFTEDRAMFLQTTMADISLFKAMDSDFGIIPLPKYDANQTEYFTNCQPSCISAICVPKTNDNIERTGMIIEAMAASGKYGVTPAVYDITLKTKYARDPESEIMLDIIVAGSRYEFSHIYNWGEVYTQFCGTISKGESFVSKFESIEAKAQAAMEKTISVFENEG